MAWVCVAIGLARHVLQLIMNVAVAAAVAIKENNEYYHNLNACLVASLASQQITRDHTTMICSCRNIPTCLSKIPKTAAAFHKPLQGHGLRQVST